MQRQWRVFVTTVQNIDEQRDDDRVWEDSSSIRVVDANPIAREHDPRRDVRRGAGQHNLQLFFVGCAVQAILGTHLLSKEKWHSRMEDGAMSTRRVSSSRRTRPCTLETLTHPTAPRTRDAETRTHDAFRHVPQTFGRSFESANLPKKAPACRNAQNAWRAARPRRPLQLCAPARAGACALLHIAPIMRAPLVSVARPSTHPPRETRVRSHARSPRVSPTCAR